MDFMTTPMLTALGCGCCCLAVVVIVAIAALLGMRSRGKTEAAVGGVESAPERGSSTNARLTFMEEAQPERTAPKGQPRELPSVVVDTANPPEGPRVLRASPTFIPPDDLE